VSVPATFRQSLAGQSFNGIVAFSSYRAPAIEAAGMDFIEQLNERIDSYDLFSPEQEDLLTSIFAEAHQIAFDGQGRVMLPPELMETAGITDRAAFVGKGKMFQIWEPKALKTYKSGARERARQQGLTVPSPGRAGGQDGGGR
jgi:MraZ protein